MEKCGRPPLPKSADPKVQARREKDRVPDAERKAKCGRKPLPPSDDPKVQARREKARANAQKKREGVKQTKAGEVIAGAVKRKLTTDDSKAKATAKAVSTIAGVIKRKLTPVSVKPAPAEPAKKVDDNRLHNLPEDLQKNIMGMAVAGGFDYGWTHSVIDLCQLKNDWKGYNAWFDETEYKFYNTKGKDPPSAVGKNHDRIRNAISMFEYFNKFPNRGLNYIPDEAADIQELWAYNSFYNKRVDVEVYETHIKWIKYKDADDTLKEKMLELADDNEVYRPSVKDKDKGKDLIAVVFANKEGTHKRISANRTLVVISEKEDKEKFENVIIGSKTYISKITEQKIKKAIEKYKIDKKNKTGIFKRIHDPNY